MEFELERYLNENKDWKDRLAREPYNLEIREDGDYVLLKYNQFASDMGQKIVQQARGCIFRYDKWYDRWYCVARAFDKFFNYGETFAANIDWVTAEVQEKIDGSLMKVWWDMGKWHVSTNGTIDAAKAFSGEISFRELFDKAVERTELFWLKLDPYYCYMFELTSGMNKLVVDYGDEPQLWYLGRRNMETMQEDHEPIGIDGVNEVRKFPLFSLEQVIAATQALGEDEEGFVVVDYEFNRIKAKGEQYLKAFKMRANGPVSTKTLVEWWQNDALDDFVAYNSAYEDKANHVVGCLARLIAEMNTWMWLVKGMEKKEVAHNFELAHTSTLVRAFVFGFMDGKVESPTNYLKQANTTSLANLVKNMEETGYED